MYNLKLKKWVGSERDEKTLHWCNDPANRDNPRAMFLKADHLLEDLTSGDVVADAIYNMEKAANLDDPDAAFAMGQMFEFGWAVGKNRKTAEKWYEKAASLGHPEAVKALKRMRSARLRTVLLSCAAAAAVLFTAGVLSGIFPFMKPSGILVQKDTDLKQTSSIEEFTEVLMDLVAENDDSLVVSGDRKSNRLILKFEGDSLDLRRFPAATVVADENNLVIIQFSTEEDAEACLQALQQNGSILFVQEDSYVQYVIDGGSGQGADPSEGSTGSNPVPDDISGTESVRKVFDRERGVEYYITDSQIYPDRNGNPYAYTSPYTGESYYSWGVPYMGFDVLSAWLKDRQTKPVVVAVMDSGVVPCDETRSRILEGWSPSGVGNGQDTSGDTSEYHGTHVAGTILDCTRGLDISVLPIRTFFNDEEKSRILHSARTDEEASQKMERQLISFFMLAMQFAIQEEVDVINMSLTIDLPYIPALDYYIEEAASRGIVIIAASGNYDPDDPELSGICTEHWPQYNDKCIIVGAIGRDGLITGFSEYGDTLDVCAPGEAVMSNVVPGTFIGTYDEDNDGEADHLIFCPEASLAEEDGTSMAAPHISALAAMLKSYLGDKSAEQIEQYIKDFAVRPAGADSLHSGAGLPIAAKFAENAADWVQPSPPGNSDDVPRNSIRNRKTFPRTIHDMITDQIRDSDSTGGDIDN